MKSKNFTDYVENICIIELEKFLKKIKLLKKKTLVNHMDPYVLFSITFN